MQSTTFNEMWEAAHPTKILPPIEPDGYRCTRCKQPNDQVLTMERTIPAFQVVTRNAGGETRTKDGVNGTTAEIKKTSPSWRAYLMAESFGPPKALSHGRHHHRA